MGINVLVHTFGVSYFYIIMVKSLFYVVYD